MQLASRLKVLFIGGTRYASPLNATQAKKMKSLAERLEMSHIAFHDGRGTLRFRQDGEFFLTSSRKINYFRQIHFLLFAFRKGVRISKSGVDAIVCQSPFEGLAGVLIKKIGKVKLIIEIHGDWSLAPVAYGRIGPGMRRMTTRLGSWALKRCDAIRAISDSTSKSIAGFGKPVYVFPTFTDIEGFLDTAENEVVPHRFIFVGQLVALKGIDTLIGAAGILRRKGIPFELLIVGEGENGGRFARLAENSGLGNSIRFLGRQSHAEIARLLKSSLALVLPSLTEGLGRVVLEAFACGRPVIGSRAGGIPESVREGETGLLFEPKNQIELAGKMEEALRDPARMLEMGRKGKVWVQQNFSTATYTANYYDMIHQTVG
jgi:glycosyltransferase involved in cell wall biosynthesis